MDTARQNKGNPGSRHINPETWLRLKLITAFKGDVPRAEIALEFVKGNPEASEGYRRFKAWEKENFDKYYKSGFKGTPFNP